MYISPIAFFCILWMIIPEKKPENSYEYPDYAFKSKEELEEDLKKKEKINLYALKASKVWRCVWISVVAYAMLSFIFF